MTIPRTVVVDISADYGPFILGGLIAFALSGCVNMQFMVYLQSYSEQWSTRALVIATWLLDLCHSAFVAVAIWDSVISQYGNLAMVDTIPWSVGPAVELTAMVTFLVQSFFAYRIYRLHSRKLTVAGPVFSLAFIRLVAASVSMAEMIKLKCYSAFMRPFPSWVFTLGLSLSASVDIMITTCLCYFLRSNRSRISSTNRIVDTLTLWTLQNGSITCFAAIASLVCWLVMPQNRIFLGLHFIIGKLYANCLLATLNARSRIRNSRNYNTTPIAVMPDNTRYGNEEGAPARNQVPFSRPLDPFGLQAVNLARVKSIEVSITRTVESKYDNDDDDDVAVDVMSTTVESMRETEEP